jgi:hypothetical protein
MALNHFSARHFGAEHFTANGGGIISVVVGVIDYVITFRRRRR